MNTKKQPETVGNEKYSSVWESTPHWTYARRDRYPSGTRLDEYFNSGSVRDTLRGRLYGFLNRIKIRSRRTPPSHDHISRAFVEIPASAWEVFGQE